MVFLVPCFPFPFHAPCCFAAPPPNPSPPNACSGAVPSFRGQVVPSGSQGVPSQCLFRHCTPLLQEARGLDAGPRLVERLVGAGDSRSAAVVKLICEEETAHVAVGVAWFSFVCGRLRVEPEAAFACKPGPRTQGIISHCLSFLFGSCCRERSSAQHSLPATVPCSGARRAPCSCPESSSLADEKHLEP